MNKFQSTLPHGSDDNSNNMNIHINNFNPRSLTGATCRYYYKIAIDANFNPRSLTGATRRSVFDRSHVYISIHAPSRERPTCLVSIIPRNRFQSTLPHGSDPPTARERPVNHHFNPRSLTGATAADFARRTQSHISIHAPSRERPRCQD